jgi:hypothetical protein
MQLLDNASVKIEIYADQVDYSKVDKRKWKPDAKKFPTEIIQKSDFVSGPWSKTPFNIYNKTKSHRY